jgi:hypothetical protein
MAEKVSLAEGVTVNHSDALESIADGWSGRMRENWAADGREIYNIFLHPSRLEFLFIFSSFSM